MVIHSTIKTGEFIFDSYMNLTIRQRVVQDSGRVALYRLLFRYDRAYQNIVQNIGHSYTAYYIS